jgi:hypothetical protein
MRQHLARFLPADQRRKIDQPIHRLGRVEDELWSVGLGGGGGGRHPFDAHADAHSPSVLSKWNTCGTILMFLC